MSEQTTKRRRLSVGIEGLTTNPPEAAGSTCGEQPHAKALLVTRAVEDSDSQLRPSKRPERDAT